MDCVRWPLGQSHMELDSKLFLQVLLLLTSHRLNQDAVCGKNRWRLTKKPPKISKWTHKIQYENKVNLDMSIKSAVRDPVWLLVYGGEARWRRWCAVCVTLHARQQDAAQGGLSGRVQQQLR